MKRCIEEHLLKWKKQDPAFRLPIILRGARQVGKTYTIENFGKKNFDTTITINFELQKNLISYFEQLDPIEIIKKLEIFTNIEILPGKTLLFLDEIQECPQAIKALRYFKEKIPNLHIIAAGSLLEFILNDSQFSFPVGRVQFMYLGPLSFKEFLFNLGQERLLKIIRSADLKNPLDQQLHEHLLKFVRQYFLIGGMPAIVNRFILVSKDSYLECRNLQSTLIQAYYNDFGKYANKAQHKYLQRLFDRVPVIVGQHFKYTSIDNSMRSRDLKVALEQLEQIGLIHRVYATNASGLPMKSQKKDNKFKLLFLDIGLMQSCLQTDYNIIIEENFLQINSGALAEQFVGQELLAYSDVYLKNELYFWEREKKTSEAEVDYVIQFKDQIFPIEVKSGKTGRLRSLQQFIQDKQSNFGLKISQDNLEINKQILSVPFYLIMELPRLLSAAICYYTK